MSTTAITLEGRAPISIAEGRLNPNQVVAQRNAILECMQKTMKVDVDYGIIPGTPKMSLYKPGSEKILSMFHLGTRILVEDLSTPDRYHYRVKVIVFHQPTDVILGEGIGEASSAESKYQWREVVCDEEWDQTPEDRKRIKWKKGNKGNNYKAFSVRQVRADMDDISNTVLKMSKKRAQIDATLTCTAASDMFAQDIEDLKDAGLDPNIGENHQPSDPLPQNLQPKQSPPAQHVGYSQQGQPAPHAQAPAPASNGGDTISEGEAKLFWAKAIGRTNDYKQIMEYLKKNHGVTNKAQILKTRIKEALRWAETGAVD